MRTTARRQALVAAVALALVATACGRLTATGVPRDPPLSPPEEDPRPSIVIILSDDQRWDTLWAMPNVHSLLAGHGITFSNGFVVNPLCCPSRASVLKGAYSHTTGVYTNNDGQPYGGFTAFRDESTIATWLQAAGYRTALVGKYLNGYSGTYVPPGWDRWFATYDNGGYYDYSANDEGVLRPYGNRPTEYGTAVLADRAVRFIRETDPGQPLFLYFTPHAPHEPATPAPGDERTFPDLPPWRPPSYDESDRSDKPAYVRDRTETAEHRAGADEFRLEQYRSLQSLDRTVAEIVDALRDTGRLSTTMIVFTSDNGYLWGEHGFDGKVVPYEESIRVPYVVRYDPLISSTRDDGHLVTNIDFAPTFAELAGVAAPGADGTSLLPLLADPGSSWRTEFLIEHLGEGSRGVPTFCAVRTTDQIYVHYVTGEDELYDLANDPYQMENVAETRSHHRALRLLRSRLADLCSPPPPGLRL